MNFGLFVMGLLLFFVSVFLILLVLVQRGRGGGLTGALGGMGGQSAFGSKAGDVFTKITVTTAVIWILLSILTIQFFNPPPRPVATDVNQIGGVGTSDGEGETDDPEDIAPGESDATDTGESDANNNGSDADIDNAPSLTPPVQSNPSGEGEFQPESDSGEENNDGNNTEENSDGENGTEENNTEEGNNNTDENGEGNSNESSEGGSQ